MEVVSSKLCLVVVGRQSCCLSPAHSWAIQSQSIFSSHWIPSRGKLEDWSKGSKLENLWNRSIENLHLKPALIVSVPLGSHPVGDGVDHVNLQKICRGRVGIVKSLLFAGKIRFVQITHYLKIFTCSVSLWHHHLPWWTSWEPLISIWYLKHMLIQYYIQR